MNSFKDKTPYYRTNLESNKERDQFTVELDAEERKALEEIKILFDIKSDSKALKLCLENAINSKNFNFNKETWLYILRSDRQRLSNYKKLVIPTSEENAMQI